MSVPSKYLITMMCVLFLLTLGGTWAWSLDDYDLSWYSINGGGVSGAAGGDFELSGTIGQSNVGQTAMTGGDFSLEGGFWPVCDVPPIIVAAISSKVHGAAGPFQIDVLATNAVECRLNGPTWLEVTFDQAIQGVGGLDNADVSLSSGTVSSLVINDRTLTINMTGATNAAPLVVGFPGIASAAYAGNVVSANLCFRVLAGDSSGDKRVNVLDLLQTKNQVNLSVNAGNFRVDINSDGRINVLDLLAVKARLNTVVGDCP